MKVREVLKVLERDGWVLPGLVTVAGKPSLELPRGTLNSILKQAGLKWNP